MAQTKRRRQTKHRGNAAGVVEARGRTGRKPTTAEKGGKAGEAARARQRRAVDRRDRPPSWRSAFYRATMAAVLMLVASLLFLGRPTQAAALFPIVLVMYWPISYYTDSWIYRRRMRKAGRGGDGRAPAR
jgi:hypothetical protein